MEDIRTIPIAIGTKSKEQRAKIVFVENRKVGKTGEQRQVIISSFDTKFKMQVKLQV